MGEMAGSARPAERQADEGDIVVDPVPADRHGEVAERDAAIPVAERCGGQARRPVRAGEIPVRGGWRHLLQHLEKIGRKGIRMRHHRDVDGGERLVVHAPAIGHRGIERAADDGRFDRRLGLGVVGATAQIAGEIEPVEADDEIGFGDKGALARRTLLAARCEKMLPVVGGKAGRVVDARHHRRAGRFGQRDAGVPVGLRPGHAAEQEERLLRPRQRRGDRTQRGARSRGQVRRREAARRRHLHFAIQPFLLHRHVEADIGRPEGGRCGDLVRAQHRLHGGLGGTRLVVPFDVGAHQGTLVGGGVDPVDPRPTLVGIDRAGRPEDHHRHTVAPSVEDRHGRMHQPDIGMQRYRHRPVGRAAIAVGDRHGMLLVQAEHDLRVAVAEIVDDGILQAAEARARHHGDVGQVERPHRRGHDVAAPFGRAILVSRRPLDEIARVPGCRRVSAGVVHEVRIPPRIARCRDGFERAPRRSLVVVFCRHCAAAAG